MLLLSCKQVLKPINTNTSYIKIFISFIFKPFGFYLINKISLILNDLIFLFFLDLNHWVSLKCNYVLLTYFWLTSKCLASSICKCEYQIYYMIVQ